jgi:hypothetical protein
MVAVKHCKSNDIMQQKEKLKLNGVKKIPHRFTMFSKGVFESGFFGISIFHAVHKTNAIITYKTTNLNV